jgi:23S rRNA pseudouridine955/2504/2580 synthase
MFHFFHNYIIILKVRHERKNMITIQIDRNEEKQRIDRFLKKYLNKAPNTFIYKILRKKYIKVNGKRVREEYFLKAGDIVEIYLADDTVEKFRTSKSYVENEGKLDVVYEDSNIILVNKPAGIDVQPLGDGRISLVDKLLAYMSGEEDSATFRPSFCNRLDRNTTGLIIAAKNYNSLKEMNENIRNRNLSKYYHSIVKGEILKEIEIGGYLKKNAESNKVNIIAEEKDGYKEISTRIRPLLHKKAFTEIEVELITGRTHQIRAHLNSIGHPLAGDVKYGGRMKGIKRYLLHSRRLKFKGFTGKLEYLNGKTFEAPYPKEYSRLKKELMD